MLGLFVTIGAGYTFGTYVDAKAAQATQPDMWTWIQKAKEYWVAWWIIPQFIPFVPPIVKILMIGATIDEALEWWDSVYEKWIEQWAAPVGQIGAGTGNQPGANTEGGV